MGATEYEVWFLQFTEKVCLVDREEVIFVKEYFRCVDLSFIVINFAKAE